MQTQDIRQLAEWLAATDIDVLALQGPGVDLRIERGGSVSTPADILAGAATAASSPAADTTAVRAPSPGVLLDRIPGRTTPLCATGTAVRQGHLLALLRIGPLLLPVTAPCDGVAGAWLVPPGSTVGYGEHLLNIVIALNQVNPVNPVNAINIQTVPAGPGAAQG